MHGPLARIRAARAAGHPTPERQLELERELWIHLDERGAPTTRGIPPAVVVRLL